MIRKSALLTGFILSVAAVAPAAAATVTFTGSEDNTDFRLVIDDAANPDGFRFSLDSINGTPADLFGLAFDSDLSFGPNAVSLVSATNLSGGSITPALTLYTNTNECGGNGCTFNGRNGNQAFDYTLRIGEQGGAGDKYVDSLVFDIDVEGSLADFSNIFVRAQSTQGPEGSVKAPLTPETPGEPAPVPLPAAGWMLLAGVGLLAARGRARKA